MSARTFTAAETTPDGIIVETRVTIPETVDYPDRRETAEYVQMHNGRLCSAVVNAVEDAQARRARMAAEEVDAKLAPF